MALKDILGPINTILTTNGALSVTPNTPPLELAATPLRDRTSTSRVTWVPTRDRFEMPVAAMTRAVQQAYLAANVGKQIPHALHVRRAGVEAHIWSGSAVGTADDYSSTEAMVQLVISAIHQTVYGAYELDGGGWVNPRSTEGNSLGHRYVLNVVFLIPVLEIQAVTPAATESQTLLMSTQTDQIGPIPPGNSTWSTTP